jgi:hypothetical protein
MAGFWPGYESRTNTLPWRANYGDTVPRECPPVTLHEQPLPIWDAWCNSQALTGVEHIFPIWPVATLRPVTKGAVVDVATATGAAAAATGVVNAVTGAVRAAIGAVTIANGSA